MSTSASGRAARYGSRSTGEKDRECQFCKKKFFRSDILRRHYKNCPLRGSQPIPGPLKKGKQRRACDFCARSKLSCDFESPCESCLASGHECTYQRILEDPHVKREPLSESGPSESSEQATISTLEHACSEPTPILDPDVSLQSGGKASIPFLLNYTNPEIKTLGETFGYSSGAVADLPDTPFAGEESYPYIASLSDELPSNVGNLGSQTNILPEFPDPGNSVESLLPGYFFPISDVERKFLEGPYDQTQADHHSCFDLSCADILIAFGNRKNELVDHLTEVSLSLPKDHPQAAPNAHLARAMPLFEHTNIQRFLKIYFHQWHRHSPILHKGTFNAKSVSLPLLLAVILTGALYSPDPNEVFMAQSMVDLAEECAFRDVMFVKLAAGYLPDQDSASTRALQCIQAAFSITQIHLRGAPPEKRRESRSTTFDKIIAACRTLSVHTTRDTTSLDDLSDEMKWRKFGQRQTRIRLICGIFNLDASFTIFYSMPPRLFIEELAINTPCSVPVYVAHSAAECYALASSEEEQMRWRFPLLKDLVDLFFHEEWSDETQQMMHCLVILHLFVLILGLLQIWISRRNTPQKLESHVMHRALFRWKSEWDRCLKAMNEEELEQAGFMRFAAVEFYYLGETLVGNDLESTGTWLTA